jgi:geranylgeranyl diphosphate synthase type II
MNKTASLIRAAIRMGAILGGATPPELENLTLFGEKIGMAFQIEDDILDETSSDEVLGKPSGSDREQLKMTYPAVHGMEEAKAAVAELTREALIALDTVPRDTAILQGIANYLVNRTY